MTPHRRFMLTSAVFLLGCATGGAASRFVAFANAEAPPLPGGAPRWAYYCLQANDVEDVQVLAAAAGREGWELAASSPSGEEAVPIWCFKRPYH